MLRKILIFSLLLTFNFIQTKGQTLVDQIEQGEVIWKFSKPRPVGQFANGDWWVLAPVTITEILPQYKKIKDSVSVSSKVILLTFYINGWEVNPVANVYKHGFDGALYYNVSDPSKSYFDSTLVPKLPYTVTIGAVDSSGGAVSIVKVVSNLDKGGKNYLPSRRIKSAKVLTVVSSIPEGNGANLFRPPYVRGEKPFYSVDNIRWDRLPSYNSPVSSPPTLESIESLYRNTGLAHTRAVRLLLPVDAYVSDYQPANCPSINEALLRLMLNDKTNEEKKSALIAVLQRGIDIIHWQIQGNVYPESGHQPGWLAIPSFTAALLGIDKYKVFVQTLAEVLGNERYSRKNFHEYCLLHESIWNPDVVLWGEGDGEDSYWAYIIKGSGNRSIVDPYGYIDGGKPSEFVYSYQVICINGYKGEILCAHLMPAMREVWFDSVYIRMTKYVDRMVNLGKWTQPDSCAPAEGIWRGVGSKNGKPCTSAMPSPDGGDTCILSYDNYRKTFGPDPNNPGKCICDKDPSDGIGRFPYSHGNQVGWQYKSKFVDAMWDEYRNLVGPPVLINNNQMMVKNFELYQNYPNPFNTITIIRYEIPKEIRVVLKIYDMLGREVKTLVDEIRPVGIHDVQFDASGLTSGIYFCKLIAGNHVFVRKMNLIK